jgi:hypothetical protein
LVSWLGHHVEEGNGPTSHIERLLNKRRSIAGEPPLTLDSINEKVKAVNDYSIVIQERRERWLNLLNTSQFKGKFLGNHKRPYLKQRDVAALGLATKRQLERVILLALSVTLNLLLH